MYKMQLWFRDCFPSEKKFSAQFPIKHVEERHLEIQSAVNKKLGIFTIVLLFVFVLPSGFMLMALHLYSVS